VSCPAPPLRLGGVLHTFLHSLGAPSCVPSLYTAVFPTLHTPLVCRSLYVICLLLCVEGGLCGFIPLPAKPGQAFQMLGPGDGSLEEGLLLALQTIGDVGLDAFVLKRDWPPVDNARWVLSLGWDRGQPAARCPHAAELPCSRPACCSPPRHPGCSARCLASCFDDGARLATRLGGVFWWGSTLGDVF
jgi:hypothetical protein